MPNRAFIPDQKASPTTLTYLFLTLKILHVIPSVSPIRGGPSQAVLEMVRSLETKGIEVVIATTDDDGPNQLEVTSDSWTNHSGAPVRFFPRFSPRIASVREFAFSSALTLWLWQNIEAYDLLHIHAIFSYPSTAAMIIARSKGIPYIVRPLGQLCEWPLLQSAFKKRLYLKLIERANLNHSQGLHLTSEQEEKESAKLRLDCPSFVIAHGLDFASPLENARQQLRSRFNLSEDEKIVLYLSRIHPKKGLNYLISALGKLIEYPFTFILAGSGDADYEAEVRSRLKASGIDNRTILPGFVEGETKRLLLQGADLYALTSHSENFGVAVLEAMAAGLPTVVTPGVALSAEIKRYQLGYVSELNTDAIAAAIESCLKQPAAAIRMGQRAQQFALKNYTWNRNADNLLRLYQTILDEPSAVGHAQQDHTAYSHLQ